MFDEVLDFQLELVLGYNPMIGRASPMPPKLARIMGHPEVLKFSLRNIASGFYEVTIEYEKIDGARGRFDLKETFAGKVDSVHRLTFGQELKMQYVKGDRLVIRLSKV